MSHGSYLQSAGRKEGQDQLSAKSSSQAFSARPFCVQILAMGPRTDLSTNPYSAMRQSQESLPRGDGAKVEWKCPRKNSTGQQWVCRPHCWTLTTGAPGPSQSPVPGEWDTVSTVKTTPHKPLSACFLISKTNKQKKRKNNYCEYILHLYITNRVCS